MNNNFIDSIINEPAPSTYQVWIQDPRDTSGDGRFMASEQGRFYVDLSDPVYDNRLQSFLHRTLDYIEHRLGGYPSLQDPLPIRIVRGDNQGGGHINTGSVCINGTTQYGMGEDAIRGLNVHYIFPNSPHFTYAVMGVEMKLPVRAAVPLNWSAIDETQFERLIYRLFALNDGFDNVQWLQKTKAPDGGRDISAVRTSNQSRVLIQAKHYASSIGPTVISDTVTLAETWNPPFNEIIILTTGTYTRDAISWVENHNNRHHGVRPTVTIESGGQIEVMLTEHPYLIAGLGLR